VSRSKAFSAQLDNKRERRRLLQQKDLIELGAKRYRTKAASGAAGRPRTFTGASRQSLPSGYPSQPG
jgi:hypothetical protein